jgi:hypothetical protein
LIIIIAFVAFSVTVEGILSATTYQSIAGR